MFLRRQPRWNTAFCLFIQLWEKYHKKLIYIQHAAYFINLLMSRKDDVSDAESVHLMPPILNSFHDANTTHSVLPFL